MKTRLSLCVLVSTVAWSLGARSASAQQDCAKLQSMALRGAKVESAVHVAAGAFAPPSTATPWLAGSEALAKRLPAFCRVAVVATPSADSQINIEIWLPEIGWNGRFSGQGNGGFAGEIGYLALEAALLHGFATAATDTGHSGAGTDAKWALGHPEKVTDFGHRAIHEMTRIARESIETYYGKQPQHSYFAACSNGGRQALMEAQRYPEDYDGILAGAPANAWTHLLTNALANSQALAEEGGHIPASKLPAIAHAVNAACDAQDGVADGVVNDPRQCHLPVSSLLQCKDGDSNQCLTPAQVTTLQKLYGGAHGADGKLIFPGYLPGAEDVQGGWMPWITGTAPGKSLMFAFGNGYFTNMVYEKADWDFRSVTVDEALKAADAKTASALNAVDANLSKFSARGGKLIVYHGWNDPAISALSSIEYYESVVKEMGKPKTEAFTRLYLVPGMVHCSDGPGANSFGEGFSGPADAQRNISLALEQWVEKRTAPGALTATKYVNDEENSGVKMTRPLCPYPQVAKYGGRGDTNDARNFVCATPGK